MEKKLTHSKWFLYLTEFFAGMSVMAVELGASRLMAPYFSSSQIVWTVIIGVIMVAMAVGNIWGGRMADKSKSPDRLYGRVIIAAIWIALIPFAGRWMIAGISFLLATFVTKNFLVWAALAACLVIFAFPCVLLGTVTPSLTKFTVDNLDDTGKTVGQLNALNTIGSIIGTFVPTFLTIPAVGTAATFLIFAGVLAAIGIVYFIFERKRTVTGIIAVVLVRGCALRCPPIASHSGRATWPWRTSPSTTTSRSRMMTTPPRSPPMCSSVYSRCRTRTVSSPECTTTTRWQPPVWRVWTVPITQAAAP